MLITGGVTYSESVSTSNGISLYGAYTVGQKGKLESLRRKHFEDLLQFGDRIPNHRDYSQCHRHPHPNPVSHDRDCQWHRQRRRDLWDLRQSGRRADCRILHD